MVVLALDLIFEFYPVGKINGQEACACPFKNISQKVHIAHSMGQSLLICPSLAAKETGK